MPRGETPSLHVCQHSTQKAAASPTLDLSFAHLGRPRRRLVVLLHTAVDR